MALQRYVNLNKIAVTLPGPTGQAVLIHPFREALDERARRPDATYVVEGEFWVRYVNGTPTSALQRFPLASAFGRETFPALPIHHLDGRAGDGQVLTDGGSRPQVAAVASPGRYRAAGDVLTPEGKIRRTNPLTGLDEEVDDIPANRNVLPPLNAPGPSPEQLRVSIIDYMTTKGIETAEQLDVLTDDELLKIPGLHPHAIPRLRENLRQFLVQQTEVKTPKKSPPKAEAPVAPPSKAKPKSKKVIPEGKNPPAPPIATRPTPTPAPKRPR